ncbi:MAG: DUF86 domain-containing protein [Mycobacterium sp.]|nr:DUF86 domain-containing protein [Mycobacterium sp.]
MLSGSLTSGPPSRGATSIALAWTSIAGLRNIVIHEYFRVERELIADIVVSELHPLATAISRLAETEGEAPENAAGNAAGNSP